MGKIDWAITCECGGTVIHERNTHIADCNNCANTYDENRNLMERESEPIYGDESWFPEMCRDADDDWIPEAQFYTHVQFAM